MNLDSECVLPTGTKNNICKLDPDQFFVKFFTSRDKELIVIQSNIIISAHWIRIQCTSSNGH